MTLSYFLNPSSVSISARNLEAQTGLVVTASYPQAAVEGNPFPPSNMQSSADNILSRLRIRLSRPRIRILIYDIITRLSFYSTYDSLEVLTTVFCISCRHGVISWFNSYIFNLQMRTYYLALGLRIWYVTGTNLRNN